MNGSAGTSPIPTTVGPQRFITMLLLFANWRPAYLTAVCIVKAGRAILATPWNTDRLTATRDSRVASDMLAASIGEGPCSLALYVVKPTSPIRYAHEIPYAALTESDQRGGHDAALGTAHRCKARRPVGTPLLYRWLGVISLMSKACKTKTHYRLYIWSLPEQCLLSASDRPLNRHELQLHHA